MIFIIQIEILDFKSAKPLQIIDLVKTPATAPEHEAREKNAPRKSRPESYISFIFGLMPAARR
jgi:hypothetical protein